MRIVEDAKDLKESIASAEREAEGGFGDKRVFLERYIERSRHIEVQILGDSHGNLVHLGERECSIQRRHQKIIEESPSPMVSDSMRREMGAAALKLASKLKYESAGTVEFLVDEKTKEFWFLEVNTRLQVEHPVTEEVTGIDLVKEQLRIAILNCSFTRSIPVTSSVTGCSTCNLVLTSKNQNSLVFSSTKNSTVPADSYFNFEANFKAAAPISRRIESLTIGEGDSSIIF